MKALRIRRFTPLWVSFVFAGGFILIRIFYRLLFGSITLESVLSAVSLAAPFALIIVACGLASSLIDVRRFLVVSSGIKIGQSLLTALAIALATIPSLLTSARRQKLAAGLRGAKASPRLLLPLMESALERSVELAAALEIRGFGSRKTDRILSSAPVINAEKFGLSYHGHRVLTDISLQISAGELIVIGGPTGSGKTSFLESIAGLAQHFSNGETSGQLLIDDLNRADILPRDLVSVVGYVRQNPRSSFTSVTVLEELACGLRLQGATRKAALETATVQAHRWGLGNLLHHDLETLSAGQAMRVAIIAALIHQPQILLLDEPLAELDAPSREDIVGLISALHESGHTIIIAEHHVDPFDALQPRFLTCDSGRITAGKWKPTVQAPARIPAVVGSDPILELSALDVGYGERVLCRISHLTINAGEVVAITGLNGVGKSTLLHDLARPDKTNPLRILGTALSGISPQQLPKHIALVPEIVGDFFQATTLEDELQRADKIARVPHGLTKLTLESILGASVDIDSLLQTHPRDLSAGTQLAVAIAIQLSRKPAVLLIDEPSRGLDPIASQNLSEVIGCVVETGTAVIFSSHDTEFVSTIAHRELTFANAELTEVFNQKSQVAS